MQQMIPISLPSMGVEEWEAVKMPIESGWITQGPMVKQFETDFATIHGVRYAFAVSNCTTALHLALLACGVGPGDEVIVPAFTWVSTANAVKYCGATPVFVDVETSTFNINITSIASAITPRTKAIIPVHLFGLCADVPSIKQQYPGLHIIEDAACASGSAIHNHFAGSLGDVGCFSFHPRKSVTTGEGGMITTNNADIAARVDMLRNHGASISEEQRHHGPRPYILPEFNVIGFNYRMTDIQGAIGVVQLGKLNKFIEERNHYATYYASHLSQIPWLQTPVVPEGYRHGWQSYVTFIDERIAPMSRNELMEFLQSKGISTRPGTHAVHMLGAYATMYQIQPSDFPGAYACNQFSMAIPLHNRMTEDDYAYVTDTLLSI